MIKGYGFALGGVLERENVERGSVMKKYCIHVSRIIEVENINEVEVFMKVDFVTQEVIGHYLVTKDNELYQIDEKTYKKIIDDRELDFDKLLNM